MQVVQCPPSEEEKQLQLPFMQGSNPRGRNFLEGIGSMAVTARQADPAGTSQPAQKKLAKVA